MQFAISFFWIIMLATGLPTILLLPTTTRCLPLRSFTCLLISIWQPCGVQGRKHSSSATSFPTLTGWNPSTSLTGSMAFITAFSSICFGKGSCTSIPFTSLSWLSLSISSSSSPCVVLPGSICWKEFMPTSSHPFPFILTYTAEAASSPTSTTASPGTLP